MCGRVCSLSRVKGGVERCGVCHEKSVRWCGGGGCWRGSCYVRDGCLFVLVSLAWRGLVSYKVRRGLLVACVGVGGLRFLGVAGGYWRVVGEGFPPPLFLLLPVFTCELRGSERWRRGASV